MRRYARKDANHDAIVKALRRVGASVHSLAAMGSGMPDALVGYRGQTWVLEFKAPDAKGRLSAGAKRSESGQADWLAAWRGGPALVVRSVDEALGAVGALQG